jgi:hypothetical protein
VSCLQVFRLGFGFQIVAKPVPVTERYGITFPLTENAAFRVTDTSVVPLQRKAEFLGIDGDRFVHIPDQNVAIFPKGVMGVEIDISGI